MSMSAPDRLPIIDVTALNSGAVDDMRAVAREIGAACERHGFFYITGHGIPDELIERMFAESARFFAIPAAHKLKVKINRANRGYVPPGASAQNISTVEAAKKKNQYESLMIRDELEPGAPEAVANNPMHGPNQWAEGLPGFKETCLEYYEVLYTLGQKFLPGFALALDLEPDHFEKYFRQPMTSLRLLHYPRQEAHIVTGYGHAPHTDYGFLTILAQDEVGGLEVYDKATRHWIQASSVPGAFVVNVGDALARWTNYRFVSTPHRVASMTVERERYSIPFFFHLDVDAKIEVLSNCCGPENPPAYPPIRFGDYLAERLAANYALARDNG